jgi:hypothetical protein
LYANNDNSLYRYEGGTTWTDMPWSGSLGAVVYHGRLWTGGATFFLGEGAGVYAGRMIGGDGYGIFDSNKGIVGDELVQLTALYNGSAFNLYVNGVMVASTSYAITLATSSEELRIGKGWGSTRAGRSSFGEDNFRGLIDEVRIYNRALTADEVAGNYRAEKYGQDKVFITKATTSVTHTSDADFSGTTDNTTVFNDAIRLASSSGYYATGTYTSLAIEIPNTDYLSAAWSSSTPASTSIAYVKFRTASTSDMAGATDWSSCYEYWNGYDLSNSSCVTDGHSYLQYQVGLATDLATSTPEFSDITINYTRYNSTGNLVSSPFDFGDNTYFLDSLSWIENLPSGTNFTASLKTAGTSGDLGSASWSDISRGDCSIVDNTVSCASTSIPSAMKDGSNDRFTQYRLNFSSDGYFSPTISQFSITATDGIETIATATQIYRSVGVGGENEIASGTASKLLTIDASGNMTFTGTAMPARVGVGDAIVFDTDNSDTITAADDIVFIHSRSSSTAYVVKTEAGINTATTTSANDTWFVYRAYTSLFNAEASVNNTSILPSYDAWSDGRDIRVGTGTNEVWNIACYGDAVDTAQTGISGWGTSENN